jgi:hypothetical protein
MTLRVYTYDIMADTDDAGETDDAIRAALAVASIANDVELISVVNQETDEDETDAANGDGDDDDNNNNA